MDQRASYGNFLAHTGRHFRTQTIANLVHLELLEKRFGTRADFACRDPVEASKVHVSGSVQRCAEGLDQGLNLGKVFRSANSHPYANHHLGLGQAYAVGPLLQLLFSTWRGSMSWLVSMRQRLTSWRSLSRYPRTTRWPGSESTRCGSPCAAIHGSRRCWRSTRTNESLRDYPPYQELMRPKR